jgi:hypothetical protein
VRIQTAAAWAAGVIAVAAFGGIAAAAEETDGIEIGVVSPSPEPTEDVEDGDEESEDGQDDSGLVCILVPIEPPAEEGPEAPLDEATAVSGEETTEDAAEQADDEAPSIIDLLAENDIECAGTGNERSASVALVPRFLAHSDLLTGAERGALISEWAKTHPNKPSPADGEDEELDSEGERRGNDAAPGQGGDHPGKGEGHGPKG